MGNALERGMVLIFSIWNSDGDFMNWMDSGDAGPCNATEGDPKLILANQPGKWTPQALPLDLQYSANL